MSGEKILIVDDERSITDLLKLHLEEEGYVTVTAQSVDKALKALDQGPIDLVMLDIRMPGKDGFDFLRAVSTKHGIPKVPVIVMTGRGELESLMEGIAVEGFVNKPFEMHLVLGTIKKVLSSKRKTVYVADTEGSVSAQAIAKELRDERYQVFFIKNMRDFMEYWAKQPADCIVMEYAQNSISGDEMIREIRKSATIKTPVIVFTYSGMDFREKSLSAGATVYLGKPQSPAAVVTAIREIEMK
ncbi:MAG: response regulator [Candidatus Omnitrophica bacterium]|nr:response regulator [Candidatus Omnitrophota bacterium]